MTIKDKKTVGETTKKLWDDSVDYTQPSPDRPYKLWLEIGVLIYLNREQLASLKEDEWQEKREQYLESRCQVCAERGGTKRCTENCMKYKGEDRVCPYFWKHGNGGIVSLDELQEQTNYQHPDESYEDSLERLTKEEHLAKLRKLVEDLEDENDKTIIELFSNAYTEREIAEVLGWNQMKVNRRKNKLFDELRDQMKD